TGSSVTKVKKWIDNRTFKTRAEAEKAKKDLELKTTGWSGEIVSFVPKNPENRSVVRSRHGRDYQTTYVNVFEWLAAQNDSFPADTPEEALALLKTLRRGDSTEIKTSKGTGVTQTRVSKDEFYSAQYGDDQLRLSADLKSFYIAYNHGWYKFTFSVNYAVKYRLKG
ncbi:hypothetical protein, partial [Sphaerimonospora thailandensis]|uniref:hypothetical protein n=1 Tax=Sphaerimonospora thailandensis TaxID=795644 RepID=UPI00194FEAFD